jgi:hypothetical protein
MMPKADTTKPGKSTQRSQGHSQDENHFGIASLVCGILGMMLPIIGIILGILAIIFSLKQRKTNPNNYATAGLVLGIVGIAYGIIIFFIMFAMLLFFFGFFAINGADSFSSRCMMGQGFSCVDHTISPDGISLSILNDNDFTLQNATLELDDESGVCSGSHYLGNIGAGRMIEHTFPCSQEFRRIKGHISISYNEAGEDTMQTAEGVVSGFASSN